MQREQFNLFHVTYGSKLYGTNTASSDTDNKVVYVPALGDLLLGKKLPIFKERHDAEGNELGVNATMPPDGVETEFFPVQTFVRDFVGGQTYALEMAHAYLRNGPPERGFGYNMEKPVYDFVREMVDRFTNAEVYSMVGFAMKQTFDYVKRGERLNETKRVLEVVDRYMGKDVRLDTEFNGAPLYKLIAAQAGLETELLTNGTKPTQSLKMNGRNYMETTTLEHFRNQLVKVIDSFGERSVQASLTAVEHKSLSHAVRVYQQAIELLDTGKITFPRPNAEFLLSVKQGKEDLETVKALLAQLDDEVQAKIKTSTLQKKTKELQDEAEAWLLAKLFELYELNELDD